MSIETFIKQVCPQIAIYWPPLAEDGYGGKVFSDPKEIFCRWEEREQVLTDPNGTIIGSRAAVFVTEDVEEEGYLFLGTLDDLDDSEQDSSGVWYNPEEIIGAYMIKQFEKIPALGSTTEFIRKAYLLVWQRR